MSGGACAGVVLAGGRSARFGGLPKGLQPLGGRRMIDRVADALRPVCDSLVLAGNAPDAARWLPDVRVIGDLHRDGGPLAGIHAALAALAQPLLVVAWDMPFVTAELLAALRAAGEADARRAAVVPESAPGHPEPLCAYYTPACLAPLAARLAAGERRVRETVDAIPGVHRLSAEAVGAYGDPARLLASVNTPEELRAAEG